MKFAVMKFALGENSLYLKNSTAVWLYSKCVTVPKGHQIKGHFRNTQQFQTFGI